MVAGVRFELTTFGYAFDDQTLSLDDSIALTVRQPPKTTPKPGILALVGRRNLAKAFQRKAGYVSE